MSSRRVRSSAPFGLIALGLSLLLVAVLVLFAFPGAAPEASGQDIGAVVPVAVDYAAPDLALAGLDGKEADLEDYRGQVVLVNLWATWCPPCKAEMPILQAYYQAHQAEGFTLIAVNAGDQAADVQAFVDRSGLTFPVWLDPQNLAMGIFRTPGLPSSYVIDRSGRVRLAWSGEIKLPALEKYVTPIIQE